MRKLMMFPCLMLLLPIVAQAETKVTIPDGTEIRLRLREDVNSATADVDDKIYFEAAEDLVVDGITVVKTGANAWGLVKSVSKKGFMGRGGKIDFSIEYVEAVDGQKIRLKKSKQRQGESKEGKSVGLALAVSPLFLLKKGKDVSLKAGTEYTIYIDSDRYMELGPPK